MSTPLSLYLIINIIPHFVDDYHHHQLITFTITLSHVYSTSSLLYPLELLSHLITICLCCCADCLRYITNHQRAQHHLQHQHPPSCFIAASLLLFGLSLTSSSTSFSSFHLLLFLSFLSTNYTSFSSDDCSREPSFSSPC